MAVRDAKRKELSRLDCKTLDAQFKATIRDGLSCSPFEAEAVLQVVQEVYGAALGSSDSGALQFRDERPLFADSFARGQERQDDRLRPQQVESLSLRLAEFAAQRRLDQRRRLTRLRRPWLHAGPHTSVQGIAQIAYFNILPRAVLQTAEELHLS
jgi:hypothetical protein